ncbi:MAG: copper chaperone, partial [Microbacterium sp.]
MTTTSYTVTGMTCGHCVASVTEEVSEIAGVTDVQVVLETGVVTVASDLGDLLGDRGDAVA